MDSLFLLQLCILAGLFICSAFFSSSEVAFFSLNPLQIRRLAQHHPLAAGLIKQILNPPTRFLSTILIGNTLVNVLISILGFAVVVRFFPKYGEWLSIVIITLLLLVGGEVIPKRIAFRWPERIAMWYAPPLLLIMRALTPARIGLEYLTDLFQKSFQARGRTLSDEEFESVVDISEERGVLQADERDMLKSILRLEDLEARDVMTPRVDLIGHDLNDRQRDLVAVAQTARVRQLVLYRDTIDHVEGLLDIRRFLLDPAHRVQAAWVPPLFVPEAAPLDRLLARFLRERRRAAVVVDEYGGTAGLITRGDILEEIIGDIDDEHADHKHLFDQAGTDRWLLDGQISLEEINQKLGLQLEAEGADRLAGWITEHLERLPRPGDHVALHGVRATVQQMRKHRVSTVLVERLPDPHSESDQ